MPLSAGTIQRIALFGLLSLVFLTSIGIVPPGALVFYLASVILFAVGVIEDG